MRFSVSNTSGCVPPRDSPSLRDRRGHGVAVSAAVRAPRVGLAAAGGAGRCGAQDAVVPARRPGARSGAAGLRVHPTESSSAAAGGEYCVCSQRGDMAARPAPEAGGPRGPLGPPRGSASAALAAAPVHRPRSAAQPCRCLRTTSVVSLRTDGALSRPRNCVELSSEDQNARTIRCPWMDTP